jgi:predicted MPP superfamily phosphohydrolase
MAASHDDQQPPELPDAPAPAPAAAPPDPATSGLRARWTWQRFSAAITRRSVLRFGLVIVQRVGVLVVQLALPLGCLAAILHLFPYRGSVDGIPFRVQGTLISQPGISADTTVGRWEFRDVDGLPIGIHLMPEDVDLLQLARATNGDHGIYGDKVRADFTAKVPQIALWLGGEAVLGVALGLALAAGLNMAARYLRGQPRRADELRHRLRQLACAGAVTAIVVGYGWVSYNPNWVRQSRLTGTLAAMQLFPSQLNAYYLQQTKIYDVASAVVGIQAALQGQIEQRNAPQTAFRIMFISDLHLAAVYPLIQRYAAGYDVKLIVNTGDESEFGSRPELTATYQQGIAAITKKIPMIWLAGNHDSPETEAIMRRIPGVIVVGDKVRVPDGSYTVSAGSVQAFGLTIGAVPDPRVYGAVGDYGSDDGAVTDKLERAAVDAALQTTTERFFDIFATHEPVAVDELRKKLPGRIRQTNAGHTHAQNKTRDIQHGSAIDLVEGSAGAGGLDNINRSTPPPPIEFSIESVGTNCQFTKIVRFQIRQPATPPPTAEPAYGDDVTVSTIYFAPQELPAARTCGTAAGIGTVNPA